jgi:hypothetical protein
MGTLGFYFDMRFGDLNEFKKTEGSALQRELPILLPAVLTEPALLIKTGSCHE